MHDLLKAPARSSFAIVESEVPINNDRAAFIRHIVTKIVEEAGNDPEAWEVKDKHNNRFIENLLCAEDHSLFAD